MLDLAIIGSGPAALTAALYAARLGLKVKVFEKNTFGGALPQISHLANFPGFNGKGEDFADSLKTQAEKAGASLEYGTCTSVNPLIVDDEEIKSRTVLIATGTEPISLDFTPEKPVSYCALCDAPLYKGKNVLVIGGGNSAVGESIHLAKIAKSVTLVSHSDLKADPVFVDDLKKKSNVKIIENTCVTKKMTDDYDGVFVFIGKHPATSFVPRNCLDEEGFIITNENHKTKLKNVFACGDVRSGTLKQAVTAAADGASAAVHISNILK